MLLPHSLVTYLAISLAFLAAGVLGVPVPLSESGDVDLVARMQGNWNPGYPAPQAGGSAPSPSQNSLYGQSNTNPKFFVLEPPPSPPRSYTDGRIQCDSCKAKFRYFTNALDHYSFEDKGGEPWHVFDWKSFPQWRHKDRTTCRGGRSANVPCGETFIFRADAEAHQRSNKEHQIDPLWLATPSQVPCFLQAGESLTSSPHVPLIWKASRRGLILDVHCPVSSCKYAEGTPLTLAVRTLPSHLTGQHQYSKDQLKDVRVSCPVLGCPQNPFPDKVPQHLLTRQHDIGQVGQLQSQVLKLVITPTSGASGSSRNAGASSPRAPARTPAKAKGRPGPYRQSRLTKP